MSNHLCGNRYFPLIKIIGFPHQCQNCQLTSVFEFQIFLFSYFIFSLYYFSLFRIQQISTVHQKQNATLKKGEQIINVKIDLRSRLGVVACSCNPATWRSGLRTVWGRGSCSPVCYVDRASALSSASIWSSRGSLGGPGCLRRDVSAQGGNTAGKSSRVEQ